MSELDAAITEAKAQHPEATIAGELAAHLPEHLRSPYWERKVDEYFTAELKTTDDPNVELCTVGGTRHDWRPREHTDCLGTRMSWACVWCDAVACGDYDEPDPCFEAYHHHSPHRSRSGVIWALGDSR